jgi:uncharacterized membrane-anchored protein YjiN (DUF445 family)
MAVSARDRKVVDKYFDLLKWLDNPSKKELIIRLTESLEVETASEPKDWKTLIGEWVDDRDVDEVVNDIIDSRINAPTRSSFD